MFLLTTVGYRWYLQSYETEKMEGIFESISIEWARKGVWIIGPTNLDLMTTPSGPCDIAGNPGNQIGPRIIANNQASSNPLHLAFERPKEEEIYTAHLGDL